MSGHSKWATIKHKKAATDAKRGKIFTKIIRELTIAARTGGADPITNPRLRTAILSAKSENMPNDNIERAIQRGTGTLEGETLDEVTFEGYGPGGVGVLVQVVTNNRNRIVSEVRHMFSKNGGNMAENGAVGWMFHRKGDIIVPKEAADEEKMMSIVLDAGAEDLRDDGSAWEVTTPPEAFEKVREALARSRHHSGHRRNRLRPAKLREAQRRASPANDAHGRNPRRSRRRPARLRQLRHRRKRNASRRRQLAASQAITHCGGSLLRSPRLIRSRRPAAFSPSPRFNPVKRWVPTQFPVTGVYQDLVICGTKRAISPMKLSTRDNLFYLAVGLSIATLVLADFFYADSHNQTMWLPSRLTSRAVYTTLLLAYFVARETRKGTATLVQVLAFVLFATIVHLGVVLGFRQTVSRLPGLVFSALAVWELFLVWLLTMQVARHLRSG